MPLSEYSDTEMLQELLIRNAGTPAPVRVNRTADVHSHLIAIGKDHTAEIVIYEDDARALAKLEGLG